MTLKKKILLGLVCAVTVPVVTTSIIVYWQSRDSITSLAEQSLEAVKTNKATAVKDYFQTIQYQVQSLAENDAVVAATLSFKKSFNNYIKDNKFSEKDIEKQRTELSRYYEGDFSEQYAAKNRGENLNSQALWENLSARAVALQYQYIYKNSHPLGSKHLLDAAEGDQSAYAKTHRSVHPEIRNFLERFGYYDIFIADRDTGHIIYSVFKELDYATSLLDGPYKDTGIAQVFRKARNFSTKGQTTLTDYRSYLPSYRDPASFIASPIISNGETVAVLIFQMPIDRLNRIMSDRAGLGETGEAYLVGSDGLPRSNSFHNEQRSLSRAFRDPESSRIESESIREGISGNQGVQLGVNYEGQKVISAYVPVDVLNHRWVLMAEITQGEAFQSISELVTAIVIAALLLIGITLLVGSFLVTKLVQLITLSVDSLYHQTQNLEHSASSMKEETTKLSQNVLRSAAAVQENASSVSEINSTLSTNSALVDRVVDRSNEVLEQLSTADQQLETMNHSFNRIGEGVAKNNEIIKLVEEISTKTKMINEIVFKTQLLAVNASIEAARAGEQGRGFTVVAEEVTKLASVSGEAAEQIDRLIIHSREIITGLIKESQGVVGQSETNVQNFRSVFATVTQNIRQVLESTKDIASAIREQRQGVVQVTSAMEEIDRSVQANQQQAQQSQLLADGLHVTADKLGEIRDQFLSITMGQGLKRRSPSRALAAPISATHKNQQPSREVEEESLADDDSFTPAA